MLIYVWLISINLGSLIKKNLNQNQKIHPSKIENCKHFLQNNVAKIPGLQEYAGDLEGSEVPTLSLPSLETPLYNNLLNKLSTTGDEDIMDKLADLFIFDELKYKQPRSSAEQPAQNSDDPYLLGLRVEHLLSFTDTQRAKQIARLASRGDPRAEAPDALVFERKDMAETMNAWRSQPQTWMDPQSLQTVNAIKRPQEYHQACKSKINTMLFQIIGNKALVELLVRFPICGAAQPASVLKRFAKEWQTIRGKMNMAMAKKSGFKVNAT